MRCIRLCLHSAAFGSSAALGNNWMPTPPQPRFSSQFAAKTSYRQDAYRRNCHGRRPPHVDACRGARAAELVDLETRLPIIVFNVMALPQRAVQLVQALGGRVESLEPAMPVPEAFSSPLLSRPFRNRDGLPMLGRVSPWAKLAVWGQTAWTKVVLRCPLHPHWEAYHRFVRWRSGPRRRKRPQTRL